MLTRRWRVPTNIMMKRAVITIFGVLVIAATSFAQSADWPLVVVEGHFTLPLPPSMELMEGTFESTTKDGREHLLVTTEDLSVWAQPKGINASEGLGEQRSAGIVVNTEQGAAGDYMPLGADMSLSAEELQKLDEDLHSGFVQSGEESGEVTGINWTGTDVVQLEGTQAIRLRYSAKMGPSKADFVVNTYMIQNYDSMYYVTATYLLKQQEKWTEDLKTALAAMRFETRGNTE